MSPRQPDYEALRELQARSQQADRIGQGYCWPSLGEACGNCHRCGANEEKP